MRRGQVVVVVVVRTAPHAARRVGNVRFVPLPHVAAHVESAICAVGDSEKVPTGVANSSGQYSRRRRCRSSLRYCWLKSRARRSVGCRFAWDRSNSRAGPARLVIGGLVRFVFRGDDIGRGRVPRHAHQRRLGRSAGKRVGTVFRSSGPVSAGGLAVFAASCKTGRRRPK